MLEKTKKIIILILAVLVLILAGTTYYFLNQYIQYKKDPQKAVREETRELINKVSKLIVLPEGEEPTIATVTDPDRLRDQPFFARAKRGDKVLIYTNARKAILYDPQENRIVEVAPINIGTTPPVATSTPETSTSTPPEE
jgi:hypothetical protein